MYPLRKVSQRRGVSSKLWLGKVTHKGRRKGQNLKIIGRFCSLMRTQ